MGRRDRDDDDDDDDDRPSRRRSNRDDDDRPARRRGCPFCGYDGAPRTQSNISGAGWAVFVILLLFFFPLCWIGLLMKDTYRVCGDCGAKLGG